MTQRVPARTVFADPVLTCTSPKRVSISTSGFSLVLKASLTMRSYSCALTPVAASMSNASSVMMCFMIPFRYCARDTIC